MGLCVLLPEMLVCSSFTMNSAPVCPNMPAFSSLEKGALELAMYLRDLSTALD